VLDQRRNKGRRKGRRLREEGKEFRNDEAMNKGQGSIQFKLNIKNKQNKKIHKYVMFEVQ